MSELQTMAGLWNALMGQMGQNKPEEPECWTHFESARRKLQMGQQQEAYEGMIYSLEMDDEYKIEYRVSPLMQLLESMEKYDEMLTIIDKFINKKPESIGFLVWRGVALRHLERMDECELCFEKAVEAQPTNDMFVTLYCTILMTSKKWDKLEKVNKKMIEYKPTSGGYHNNYIQALENQGKNDSAEKHVEQIFEKYGPISPSIDFICGDYYYKHEKFNKAEKCLKKAAELDLKNEKYQQFYIRSLLQNGKQSDADKYCHELISKDPNNPRWINTVGYICFDAFDFESAAKHFEKCCKLQPNDPYNVSDLAMVLCELNRLDQAENLIKEILKKQPNFISGQYRLARILEYKNKYQESKQIYLKIIKIDPNKAKMNMGYAHLLYLMEQYEESMKYFEISKNIDKANPWYYFWYGLLLINDHYKRYNEAIKLFEKCLNLQATHHKCHYQYANLLFNILKKDKKKAIEHMKQAVSIDYKNKQYRIILKKFMDNYDPNDNDNDDDNKDDEKEQKSNDNISKLVKSEYIFKSIDNEKKEIIVMDNDFKDIIFKLDGLNLNDLKNINAKIEEGAKTKKDVKIIVVETHTKNSKVTKKVSHAEL